MPPEIDLLVIGDAMVDITVRAAKPRSGGAVPSRIAVTPGGLANVAVAARGAGARTGFLGRIGRDPFGDCCERDLVDNGVVSYCTRSDLPTGLCVNFIAPRGERTMYTSRGANVLLTEQDLGDAILDSTRMIFVSGFAMETSVSATVIEGICRRARSACRFVAIGGGAYNIIARRPRRFARLVGRYGDLLILNGDEAAALTGQRKCREILGHLAKIANSFVMTEGAQGSHSFIDGVSRKHSCPKSRAVDTTGSGDVFAGVLLAGILNGIEPEKAIEAAHRQASRSVRRIGPRP